MKKKSSLLINVIFGLVFLTGVALLAYPTFAQWWNSSRQSKAVAGYIESIESIDTESAKKMMEEAHAYNETVLARKGRQNLTEAELEEYSNTLMADRVIGYIEIPSIQVSLPIYHGTDEAVLQIGIGHLEWSSLPVGGEGTHTVLSGHRGLPSAQLFTNLDKLSVKDTFNIRVLDQVAVYEVDQILIVEPDQTASLSVVPGEDLATLVTCTPYGVNSHRLLVRGHRVENLTQAQKSYVSADAAAIRPSVVAIVLAMPLLCAGLIFWLRPRKSRKERKLK